MAATKRIHKLNQVVTVTATQSMWHNQKGREVDLELELVLDHDAYVADGVTHYGSGEIRAYFDARKWNTDRQGLLYNDPGVRRQIQAALRELGYRGTLGWSEHGMQEFNYCSFDASHQLVRSIVPGAKKDAW